MKIETPRLGPPPKDGRYYFCRVSGCRSNPVRWSNPVLLQWDSSDFSDEFGDRFGTIHSHNPDPYEEPAPEWAHGLQYRPESGAVTTELLTGEETTLCHLQIIHGERHCVQNGNSIISAKQMKALTRIMENLNNKKPWNL